LAGDKLIQAIGEILRKKCRADDIIVSGRMYKETLSQEKAIQELKNNMGLQFDASIVKVFIETVLGKEWN